MKKVFGVLLALIPTATILGTAIAEGSQASATVAFDVGAGESKNVGGTWLCDSTYYACGRILAVSRIYDGPTGHYCDSRYLSNGANYTLGTTQTWQCQVNQPAVATQAFLIPDHDVLCPLAPFVATGNKTTSWTAVSTANTLNNPPTTQFFNVSPNSNCTNTHPNSFRAGSWGL